MADNTPLINQEALAQESQYTPRQEFDSLPLIPFTNPLANSTLPIAGEKESADPLVILNRTVMSAATNNGNGSMQGGSVYRPLSEVQSDRYSYFLPGADNEDIYGAGQGFFSKAANGIGKGLGLAGTTFINGTVGLVYGVGKALKDEKFSSFYDNELTRSMDEFSKKMEDWLPNYYTAAETNAEHWYSPSNILTGNFLFDKLIKNAGFAVGAIGAGAAWGAAFRAIGLTGKLMQMGEALQPQQIVALEAAISAAPEAERAAILLKGLESLTAGQKALSTIGKGLGQSDRVLTAFFGTTGEAGMEALQATNEYRDTLINDYKNANNGNLPTGDVLSKINESAEKVGNTTFGLNTALLTATNYIQFPKILGSTFKGEKTLLNREINSLVQNGEGAFVRDVPKTVFGKFLANNKIIKAGKFASKFLSKSEGFEEGAQYAIQTGTQNYYDRAYDGKETNWLTDLVGAGVSRTFNDKEGMEGIFLGALTGGIMQSGAIGTYKNAEGKTRIGIGKSGWIGEAKDREKNTVEALSDLNKSRFVNYLNYQKDAANRAESIQQDRVAAIRQGEVLESKDLETDYQINYLQSRIKWGKFDSVKNDIDRYRAMLSTPEGFEQLKAEQILTETDAQESASARLDALEQRANSIKTSYSTIYEKYAGLVNKEGGRIFTDGVIDKLVYSAAKVVDYNERLTSLATSLQSIGINTLSLTDEGQNNIPVIANGKDKKSDAITEAIKSIDNSNISEEEKEEKFDQLRDFMELSLRQVKFRDEYRDIKSNPEAYTEEREQKRRELLEAFRATDDAEEITALREGNDSNDVIRTAIDEAISRNIEYTAPEISLIRQKGEQEKSYKENYELSKDKFIEIENQKGEKVQQKHIYLLNSQSVEELDKFYNNLSKDDKEIYKDFYTNAKTYFANREVTIEQFLAKEKKRTVGVKQALEQDRDDDVVIPTAILPDTDLGPQQSKAKSTDVLFFSTTAVSEDNANEVASPAAKRSRAFLNNMHTFPNRNSLRAILITANQEEGLGVKGITALASNGRQDVIDKMLDVEEGVVLSVMVDTSGNYVDVKGKPIGKVGSAVDINSLIFSTLPTTSLTWRDGKPRFRAGEETEAKKFAAIWKQERAKLFSRPASEVSLSSNSYTFSVSRGIPEMSPEVEGVRPANNIVGSLITEADLKNTNILQVSTGTPIGNYNITSGRPFIQKGDFIQPVSNSKFSKKKAEVMADVFQYYANQMAEGETISPRVKQFIKTNLYWGKTKSASPNMVYTTTQGMRTVLHIGEYTVDFSPASIIDNREEVVAAFENLYHNINNATLINEQNTPYDEITGINPTTGEIISANTRNSYREYLLVPSKGESVAPLYTIIRPLNPNIPEDYNYKQKYITLESLSETAIDSLEQSSTNALTELWNKIYFADRAGNDLVEGFANVAAFNAAVPFGSDNLASHGMGKSGMGSAVNDLLNLFKNGIDLNRRGGLDIAPLTNSTGANDGTTAGGSAYRDGVFILVGKKGHVGKFTNMNQIAGVLVNNGVTDAYPDFLPLLREAIPSVQIESYNNAAGLTESIMKETSPSVPKGYVFDGTTENRIKFTNSSFRFTATNNNNIVSITSVNREDFLAALKPGVDEKIALPQITEAIREAVQKNASTSIPLIKQFTTLPVLDAKTVNTVVFGETSIDFKADASFNVTWVNPLELAIFFSGKKVDGKAIGEEAANTLFKMQMERLLKSQFEEQEQLPNIAPVAPPNIQPPTEAPPASKPAKKKLDLSGDNSLSFRIANGPFERMTKADLASFKKYAAANVSGLPYEVLENMIATNDGRQAFGEFRDGVIRFYNQGMRGTEYHEVGEAIWNSFLNDTEKEAIYQEFKNREGKYKDRESGKVLAFSEATNHQIKEKVLDEFADYRVSKLPARSLTEWIVKLWEKIKGFFNSFSTTTKVEELFDRIDGGEFNNRIDFATSSTAYRAAEGMTEQETHDTVQDMVAKAVLYTLQNAKSLFAIESSKITEDQIFNGLKPHYAAVVDAYGEKTWEDLKVKTKQWLSSLRIQFDEEGTVAVNDEDRNRNEYSNGAFSIDAKKSSPAIIRLMISSLVKTVQNDSSFALKLPELAKSESNGYILLDYARSFAILMNELAYSPNIDVMMKKLINLANNKSDFIHLAKRLGVPVGADGFLKELVYDGLDDGGKGDAWRLLIQFYSAFAKQNPVVDAVQIEAQRAFVRPLSNREVDSVQSAEWVSLAAVAPNSWIEKKGEEFFISSGIKNAGVDTLKQKVNFLNKFSIPFTMDDLQIMRNTRPEDFKSLNAHITKIKQYANLKTVASANKKSFGIERQMDGIASLFNKMKGVEKDTSYYFDGERVNSFDNHNALSFVESWMNNVSSLDELRTILPQYNDVFSANSRILKLGGRYFNEDGSRTDVQFATKTIRGIINQDTAKTKSIGKLLLAERDSTSLNQAIKGVYPVLVAADSSTEWQVALGNEFSFVEFNNQEGIKSKLFDIFSGYLKDEIALAKEDRNYIKAVNNAGAKSLRFFQGILTPSTIEAVNSFIEEGEDIDSFIEDNRDVLTEEFYNASIGLKEYTKADFIEHRVAVPQENSEWKVANLSADFTEVASINSGSEYLTSEEFENLMHFYSLNSAIASIENHKLFFGDPFQFAIKKDSQGNMSLDANKRIKSFLSPRKSTFDHPAYNAFLNTYNNIIRDENGELVMDENGEYVSLTPSDFGYHNHKPYLRVITIADVNSTSPIATSSSTFSDSIASNYNKSNEADAQSYIPIWVSRESGQKNGTWSDGDEKFYHWDMANMRLGLAEMGEYEYTNNTLREYDEKLRDKYSPASFTPLKPISTGSAHGASKFELQLIKTSEAHIPFVEAAKHSTLLKLMVKMFNEKVDEITTVSAHKVGVQTLHTSHILNEKGTYSFNEAAFPEGVKIAHTSRGIQVETQHEDEATQTVGSQLTKLAFLDIFSNGETASPEVREKFNTYISSLEALQNNGFENLRKKLGYTITKDGVIFDRKKLASFLESEVGRRGLPDNIRESLQIDNESNEFVTALEATPAYASIARILYSFIEKQITRQKVSGGPKVQISSLFFESEDRKAVYKPNKDSRYEYVTDLSLLTEEQKKSITITSTDLKFYSTNEKGELNAMEVYLPMWFKKQISQSKKLRDMSEQELITYINSTEEGKKLLTGIGFRIPTQGLNSVEYFTVKGFLHESMGDSIVVPSEITTKAGSDFDIDKLNTYLRNTYIDAQGDLKIVPSFSSEEEALSFIKEGGVDYSEMEDVEELVSSLFDYENAEVAARKQDGADRKMASTLYRQSLENAYYDAMQDLITLPQNVERILTPNSNGQYEQLAKDNDDNDARILNPDNKEAQNRSKSTFVYDLLKPTYINKTRDTFLVAKYWVGAAAVNNVAHALFQLGNVKVDVDALNARLSFRDREFYKTYGTASIMLPHNPTLSQTLDVEGTYISDTFSAFLNAVVDVAKDPFIMRVVYHPSIMNVHLALVHMGVPVKTQALFFQQPVIKQYMMLLDESGRTGFNTSLAKQALAILQGSKKVSDDKIDTSMAFTAKKFKNDISLYNRKLTEMIINQKKLGASELGRQGRIIAEFLKYQMLGENLMKATQAITWDTARFSSAMSIERKNFMSDSAFDKNLFMGLEQVMDTSFLSNTRNLVNKAQDSLGNVLSLEKPEVRARLNSILAPYISKDFMNATDRDRVGLKLINSYISFLIARSNQDALNFRDVLSSDVNAAALRLKNATLSFPNSILSEINLVEQKGAYTISIRRPDRDSYTSNRLTGMLREFKEMAPDLYNDIITLALVQGTSSSPISFYSLIPIEDYTERVRPIISLLDNQAELDIFASQHFFERNNWNDDAIVPTPNVKFARVVKGEMKLASQWNTPHPIIKLPLYTFKLVETRFGEQWMYKNNMDGSTLSKKQVTEMRKNGDMTHRSVVGFELVMQEDGVTPLEVAGYKGTPSYLYRPTNLLGAGYAAFEITEGASVLNNNTYKVVEQIVSSSNNVQENSIIQEESLLKEEENITAPFFSINKNIEETIEQMAASGAIQFKCN